MRYIKIKGILKTLIIKIGQLEFEIEKLKKEIEKILDECESL